MVHSKGILGVVVQGESKLDASPPALSLLGQKNEQFATFRQQCQISSEKRQGWRRGSVQAAKGMKMEAACVSCNKALPKLVMFLTYAQFRKSTHHLLSGIEQTIRMPSNPFGVVFPSDLFSWACVFRNRVEETSRCVDGRQGLQDRPFPPESGRFDLRRLQQGGRKDTKEVGKRTQFRVEPIKKGL